MKDSSFKVIEYLQKHNNVSAQEVAEALGLTKRFVDSVFSAVIVREKRGERKILSGKTVLSLNTAGKSLKKD